MPARALTFTDLSADAALKQWIRLRRHRGKSVADSLRKIMRAWVFAAWEMIPDGNKPAIRAYLMQATRKYAAQKTSRARKRDSAAAQEMRGTMAAAIVWKLDWKGARGLKGVAFFKLAKKFFNARLFSSKLHRAGMFATFDLVKGRPSGTSGPRYKKHPPGGASEKTLTDAAEILSENWASSKDGDGIQGIAGSAFEATIDKVIGIFRSYAVKDEFDAARKFGFAIQMQ